MPSYKLETNSAAPALPILAFCAFLAFHALCIAEETKPAPTGQVAPGVALSNALLKLSRVKTVPDLAGLERLLGFGTIKRLSESPDSVTSDVRLEGSQVLLRASLQVTRINGWECVWVDTSDMPCVDPTPLLEAFQPMRAGKPRERSHYFPSENSSDPVIHPFGGTSASGIQWELEANVNGNRSCLLNIEFSICKGP
jgi:hypothetical protein